uniref:Uncharacterized protein n=1 Tax=Chrysemys picta bellii TaxID=8478 RepID=A0A8C3I7K5_CHRPI
GRARMGLGGRGRVGAGPQGWVAASCYVRFRPEGKLKITQSGSLQLAMATESPVGKLEDEVTCSICLEYFKAPVSIHCGHNFCQACIDQCWGESETNFSCPQCRETAQQRNCKPNRELGRIAEIAKQLSLRVAAGEEGRVFFITLVCTPGAKLKQTNKRKYFFTQRTVNLWNFLPEDGQALPLTLLFSLSPLPANVTLDPDTAHELLTLSEDGKTVSWGGWHVLPHNPKRFNLAPCVLGCEGFISGRHYWEVEVGDGGDWWAVGVARESVRREEWIRCDPEEGIWALSLHTNQDFAFTCPLTLSWSPKRIRVSLDYEGGQVAFFDANSWASIFTFPLASFAGERIFPFFWVHGDDSQLRLYP